LLQPLIDPEGPALTIVSAPAGSGKTTLLDHAAELAVTPVVRYQAQQDHQDEASLVAAMSRAIAAGLGLLPSPARTVRDLLDAVGTVGPLPALVLADDLHELDGTDAEETLERLVRGWPPGWRLVLGCRRAPLADLPALRMSPDVRELDGEDLRFRSWEVEELFGAVHGQRLEPESAAALARRTGGWAAGLALFHLATVHHTPVQLRRAVEELGTGSRLLRSYLARNVLSELPPDRRDFLTRTCALGTLTGPLCDELLDTTHSLGVLEELADAQLFTSCADDGLTFHYHQVMQSHLEVVLLEELGPAEARRWYSRCAALLEESGLVPDALRAHARAEDWASLRGLLHTSGVAPGGGPAPSWQDLLPAVLRTRDPWCVAADARRRLRQGDLPAAVRELRRAEELAEEPLLRSRCRAERTLIDAWRPGDPASGRPPGRTGPGGAHWSQRLRAALRAAPDSAAGAATASPSDALVDGVALLLAGRPTDALDRFEGGAAGGGSGWLARALELGSLVAEMSLPEEHPALRERLEGALLRAEIDDQPWFARQVRGLIPLVVPEVGRRGPGVYDALLAECEAHGDAWGAALVQLIAGAAGTVGRPDDPADDAADDGRLTDAAQRFAALDAPVLQVWADCARAVLRLRGGDPTAAASAHAAEHSARGAHIPAAAAIARAAAATATSAVPGAGQPPVPPSAGRIAALSCLGGFRLSSLAEYPATPCAVDLTPVRPRARALLRYLAVHLDCDVHRETLIEALWPGSLLAAGTRSLQVAVSSVRKALDVAGLDGAAVLQRHAEAYRLQLPCNSTADVRDLEREVVLADVARTGPDLAAAVRHRTAALALYTGELLPEDGPAEWVVGERERLRLLAAATASVLSEELCRLGQLPQAIAVAQRAVQLDPWSDLGWRRLIELHDAVGDRIAAGRCRRQHERVTGELVLTVPRQRAGELIRAGPDRQLPPGARRGRA
jgi:DNA-binding SARP family transcriptional activator